MIARVRVVGRSGGAVRVLHEREIPGGMIDGRTELAFALEAGEVHPSERVEVTIEMIGEPADEMVGTPDVRAVR